MNEKTLKYIEHEWDDLPEGSLIRGTDYIALKPQGHPVQPSINMLTELVEAKLAVEKYDFIYVATEEQRLYDLFVEKFGHHKILQKKNVL